MADAGQPQVQDELFHDVCSRLRRNDATLTVVKAYYFEVEMTGFEVEEMTDVYARPLYQALMGNSVVTKLDMLIDAGMTLSDAEGFANFIACSPSLRELELSLGSSQGGTAKVEKLLFGIGLSRTIENLRFYGCCKCSAVAFASCLQGSPLRRSLKTLRPPSFHEEDGDKPFLVESVANAVLSLASLETLDLTALSGSQFTHLILARLAELPSLKGLEVNNSSEDVAARVRDVFQWPIPLELERLELIGGDPTTILPALYGYARLRELTLNTIPEDEEAATLVAGLLRNNQRIEKLVVSDAKTLRASTKIFDCLVGDNSNRSLQRLDIDTFVDAETHAVELRNFWTNFINNIKSGLAPQFKHLQLHCFPAPEEEMLPYLVRALEQNTSLIDVSITSLWWSSDYDDIQHAIQYFCMRNKYPPHRASTALSTVRMIALFQELQEECHTRRTLYQELEVESNPFAGEPALSVIYDTLREQHIWKDDIQDRQN